MELLIAALILVGIAVAALVVGALYFVYVLVLFALAMLWVGGLFGLMLFGISVFIGNLLLEIYKHYREKQLLKHLD